MNPSNKSRRKKKIIEVIEGYASIGETGHIKKVVKFGLDSWEMPIVYLENPNPDNFRKVRITYEDKSNA